jgi:predicted nucleotidyltransferase
MREDAPVALTDERLGEIAARLAGVPGIVGVLLGGSRARGEHTAESDTDLGLYYRSPFDLDAARALARDLAGPGARLTEPGEWGPWVDGGGWLTVDGAAVDWIYRDLDRVQRAWRDAEQGRYAFHGQAGHPLGVPDFAYAGEVALGVVLADPSGELAALQQRTRRYPPALTERLVAGLWEADFLAGIARKAVSRGDAAYGRPMAGQREGRGGGRGGTARGAGAVQGPGGPRLRPGGRGSGASVRSHRHRCRPGPGDG